MISRASLKWSQCQVENFAKFFTYGQGSPYKKVPVLDQFGTSLGHLVEM